MVSSFLLGGFWCFKWWWWFVSIKSRWPWIWYLYVNLPFRSSWAQLLPWLNILSSSFLQHCSCFNMNYSKWFFWHCWFMIIKWVAKLELEVLIFNHVHGEGIGMHHLELLQFLLYELIIFSVVLSSLLTFSNHIVWKSFFHDMKFLVDHQLYSP